LAIRCEICRPAKRQAALDEDPQTIATGAALFALITMFGPISGAHFNPVVTGVFWCQGEIPGRLALLFCLAQVAGGIAGTLVAHLMFELPVFQLGMKVRAGPAQLFAEWVATFGLLLTILLTRRVWWVMTERMSESGQSKWLFLTC